VEYFSGKADFGRLPRIVGGEGDRKEENTARIRRVTLVHNESQPQEGRSSTHGTHNRSLPLEHVIASRASVARRGRITSEIDQFLEKRRHHYQPLRYGYSRCNALLMRLRAIDIKNLSCSTWITPVENDLQEAASYDVACISKRCQGDKGDFRDYKSEI